MKTRRPPSKFQFKEEKKAHENNMETKPNPKIRQKTQQPQSRLKSKQIRENNT